jgi:hypothetical protein
MESSDQVSLGAGLGGLPVKADASLSCDDFDAVAGLAPRIVLAGDLNVGLS